MIGMVIVVVGDDDRGCFGGDRGCFGGGDGDGDWDGDGDGDDDGDDDGDGGGEGDWDVVMVWSTVMAMVWRR